MHNQQITPLANLSGMAADGHVSGISGTIIRVEKWTGGTNRFGPYSFQKIELKDGSGTARVKLKNHPEMGGNWTNAAVTITGEIGVDDYQGTGGRSSRAWLVNEKCHIAEGFSQATEGYQRDNRPQQQPQSQQRMAGPQNGGQGQQMPGPQGNRQQTQHHQQPRQQYQQPRQDDGPPPREPDEHPSHQQRQEQPKVWRPHGQTVGMALNNARSILLELYKPDGEGGDPNYFTSPEFCRDLWEIGSDFIRVAKKLEAGELAPGAVARAKAEAAAAQQQRQAERQQAPQRQQTQHHHQEGSNDPPQGDDWEKNPEVKW